MKFLQLSIFMIVFFALACGGGDDEVSDDATPQPTSSDDDATVVPNTTEAASDSPSKDNRAVVSIGDRRYEFDMSTSCIAIGGAVGGFGRATDGSDVTVDIDIPPPDWEAQNLRDDIDWSPPSIILRDDVNDLDWAAGGEVIENFISADPGNRLLEPGQSQVDGFVNDGSHASGTATFVETGSLFTSEDPPEPVAGTFEITCP